MNQARHGGVLCNCGKRRCNTLQHTVAHYNTLKHTATHCNTLQHTATLCNTPCIRQVIEAPFVIVAGNGTAAPNRMKIETWATRDPHTCHDTHIGYADLRSAAVYLANLHRTAYETNVGVWRDFRDTPLREHRYALLSEYRALLSACRGSFECV